MEHKNYYTVQVTYKCGPETKIFRITNLDSLHLQQLRERMYVGGVYRRIDDDTGEVISPWNIIETMIYKQAHFFSTSADRPLEKTNTSSKTKTHV